MSDNLNPEEFRNGFMNVQALLKSYNLPQLGDLTDPTQENLIETIKS